MRLRSGSFVGRHDFRSRTREGNGTNPEELLGAAHAACFSMAQLTNAAFTVKSIHTTTKVHFEARDGARFIHSIEPTEASASDVAAAVFEEHAQSAKKNCSISRAVSRVDIQLLATLLWN